MRKYFPAVIIVLAVLKFVLPFLLQHPIYELHRDEYLYYAQGRHLDFGFLENPPLIGLLGWISWLCGGAALWIKFWPALFGAALLLLTARIAKEMGGGPFAQTVAALGILLSTYLRTHFLFQPNFLDIFFWTLAAYFIVRYINTGRERYFYWLALAFALGWWGKYSVLFLIASFFMALLLSPQRNILIKKRFWLAVSTGIVLILPNLFWQYLHNWPLAHHMAELRDTQLQYINKADFIKEQLLMLFPVAFVWLAGLIWLLRHEKFSIIGWMYLGVIFLLMLGSGKGYYALGAYPMLLAAGGVCIERMGVSKSWVRYAAIALILLFSLPFIPVLLPVQAPQQMAESNARFQLQQMGILKWEDQQNHPVQQDFADMLGWKELTKKTEGLYNKLSTFSKAHTLVYCRNYGQAGALRYYAQTDAFRNKVFSDNGTFLLWISMPLHFENLIFVGSEMPERDDEVFQHFKKVMVVDSVSNQLSRQYGDKVIFFQQADSLANLLANEGLAKKKAVFTR